MSDTNETPPAPPNATERAEAQAIRKRWVTLAEIVAVAGLLISAFGLWMTWSDRRADESEKRVEKTQEAHSKSVVKLVGAAEHGGETLALKDASHDVQSVDLRFPAALGVAAQSSILDPHIDARLLTKPMLALTEKGPAKAEGRVPVLVTAHYWDADQQRSDTAIYDLVWQTEGRFLQGRAFRLKGLMLRERTGSAKRLEAIWAGEKPKPQ